MERKDFLKRACGILLRKAVSPSVACQCSVGWQKQAFETVFGKPVAVTLQESVLQGGWHCAFEVRATA